MTLLELLAKRGAVETATAAKSDDPCLHAEIVMVRGTPIILIERTYRAGVKCIGEPTSAELQLAREGDIWPLWNSTRAVLLDGVIHR